MGILVANNGGIYEIDKPLANPKPIIEYKEADIRHADFYVNTDFVYAVREIHKSENDAPENLLIRARISTREEEVVASGADFYAEPRISPDGKMLAWLEWNNPNMPWDQTTVNVIKINEDGSLGTQLFRLYSPLGSSSGTNYHGIQWSMQNNQPKLYVISDATGWWNVYEVGFSESGVFTKNVYPVDKDIGQPLWQFADDRPYAINSSYVVFGFDNKLWRKNLSNEEALVELNTPDFTSFSLLTLTKNNVLFCVASGPKRSQSLLRIDLHSNESVIIRETRSSKEIEDFDISMPEKLTFQSDGVNVEGYFYPPYIMHKFEYYYNMTLIADYPEQIEVYTERSPINHIDKVTTPIAFIHGTKDPVVPMEQSKIFYEALVKKNIVAALMLLEGEAHGFRKSESIQKSVDATYYFLCKALGIEPSVSSEIQIVNLNASKL
uniref:Peptidase S9 prolyl oligopeptidase catalytic domain-containing protein n=1 Tax=Acrobeloides nanus TaxID=290746 RepID=A0A914C1K4_9BILA